MKGLFLSLFVFFSIVSTSTAQQMMPVKWTFQSEKIDNQNYELIMTADVEPGWYVYSQNVEDGGPVATHFKYAELTDIKLVGQATEVGKKKAGYDEMFEMEIIKYSDKVKFFQKVQVKKGTKSVSGKVEFMTCDDSHCLPPSEIPFTIALK